MLTNTDVIILGGGCAGLSLAMRLADLRERGPRAVVIESRTRYTNDRTWCFWGTGSARLSHLVRHRWKTVSLAIGERRVTVDCRATPYQMIPAEVFYTAAVEAIAETPRVELAMGETITSEPRKDGDLWRIETTAGQRCAKMIVDTRPGRRPERGAASLWQSFSGQEIECDAARFDPDSATLMSFLPTRNGRTSFLYVLPVSSHRAVVEATVFSPDPLGPRDLAGELEAGLARQVGGAGFSVLRSEHGILPMGLAAPAPSPDVSHVRAGLAAGGARAASGFAFQRIQRWADACAEALAAGQPPVAHPPDPWRMRAMDGLFLRVLRARPELAPDLFLALFAMRNPARIVRFMSDCATFSDCATIALALPAWPFLREIPGGLAGRALAPAGGRSG